MVTQTIEILSAMLLALTFSACTSTFEPRMMAGALAAPSLPTAKEVRAGVQVSIEEYFSSHKSRRAFDADVGSSGVLPILIHIENRSAQDYRIERGAIHAAINGNRLADLHGLDAAAIGALRNPAWNALVNTAAIGPMAIFFGVGTLAGSASQTQKINRQIEQHFERMELPERILKPTESANGFVFFRMPAATSSLENLALELTLKADPVESEPTKPLVYRLGMGGMGARE